MILKNKELQIFSFLRRTRIALNPKNINSNNKKLPTKKLIMIGRLEDQKNYEFVIKQLNNTDYELNIFGTGSLESELKALDRKLNVNVNGHVNCTCTPKCKCKCECKCNVM